jgi:hypothetical protein
MSQTTKIITDSSEAAQIIAEAPSYTEWTLAYRSGTQVKDLRLMARDLPREGRRCTCLTSGTEWFDITADSLSNLGFVSLTVR